MHLRDVDPIEWPAMRLQERRDCSGPVGPRRPYSQSRLVTSNKCQSTRGRAAKPQIGFRDNLSWQAGRALNAVVMAICVCVDKPFDNQVFLRVDPSSARWRKAVATRLSSRLVGLPEQF